LSTGAGDIALESLERLSDELRKDLASIEQMLAEIESDEVVKRSRIEELAVILHNISENTPDGFGSLDKSSGESAVNNLQTAHTRLNSILGEIREGRFDIGFGEEAVELYTGIRERLMTTINGIDLAIVALRKFAHDAASQRGLTSVKLESSTMAPGSRLGLGTSAIIRSQELERQRIAREIHDGPAQAIANVVLRMDILAKIYEKDPSKVPSEIARMKEIAQGALAEIRGFIFDLRPMTLQDLGLVATIKRVVSSAKDLTKIDARFVIEGEERPLGQLVSLAVFRIAQEAFTNLRKYSKCSVAWVHLKYLKNKVVLVVEDDGVGFDVNEIANSQRKYVSFGLLGMKERADDINAELEISSVPGQGTKVVLIVPTENNPAIEDKAD
jgi:signal transduction histidine kinase